MTWTSVSSTGWPITIGSSSSTTAGWSAPVTVTQDGPNVVAELTGSRHGIFGVGPTLAEALRDLRAAIRDFACVLGIVPCSNHPQEKP